MVKGLRMLKSVWYYKNKAKNKEFWRKRICVMLVHSVPKAMDAEHFSQHFCRAKPKGSICLSKQILPFRFTEQSSAM